MGKLRDLLAEETADHQTAALSAAHGRSMTGLSGRVTEGKEPPAGVQPAVGAPPRRPMSSERVPFGALEQTMAVAPIPGYRLYWFIDAPGRIARAKRAGYEHVTDDATGDMMALVSGRNEGGGGQKSYLMKIPQQWYEEDMAAQKAARDARLAEIKQGRTGPGADDNRYIPKQGIRVEVQ